MRSKPSFRRCSLEVDSANFATTSVCLTLVLTAQIYGIQKMDQGHFLVAAEVVQVQTRKGSFSVSHDKPGNVHPTDFLSG